jgi:hypothetical protein
VERISRFVVPVSGALAAFLSGALGLTIAGIISMEAFSLVVPVCMLVLWSMGDWRSPSERAAMIRANDVPGRSISRPRLGS